MLAIEAGLRPFPANQSTATENASTIGLPTFNPGPLPAVATPVGALPMQFKHGVDALITATVDADALAKAIDKLCSDKQLYETLSLGAYNSYQASGPAKAASQWNNLYAIILDKWKNESNIT